MSGKGAGAEDLSCREFAAYWIRDCRIDSYCYNLQRLELPDAVSYVSGRVKEGLRTTYYVCCGPDCPNTFARMRPARPFGWGPIRHSQDLTVSLRWAWNCWPRNPMRDASFDGNAPGWKAGDVSCLSGRIAVASLSGPYFLTKILGRFSMTSIDRRPDVW